MKYNDTIDILKSMINAIMDPMSMANTLGKNETFKSPKYLDLNTIMNNSNTKYQSNNNDSTDDSDINYTENSNKEDTSSVPVEESESYNYNKSNGYYNKQQDTSSNPQGVIDSITQELTSVRLQQAIILSEIVGKPRSKTRKKRRF